jgi:hypothetical protein
MELPESFPVEPAPENRDVEPGIEAPSDEIKASMKAGALSMVQTMMAAAQFSLERLKASAAGSTERDRAVSDFKESSKLCQTWGEVFCLLHTGDVQQLASDMTGGFTGDITQHPHDEAHKT